MKVAFRVDASLLIGSGHVMRCLTLADALRAKGAQCHFICRAHPGHLFDIIHQRGYMINALAAPVQQAQAAIKNSAATDPNQQELSAHTAWLGATWQADAQETAAVLETLKPDWLVADHYALDQRWEDALTTPYGQLLVIDDLADRPHQCQLLLDQNLGRVSQDYAGLVPAECQVLSGPYYALLRPEYAMLRSYSLQRRQQPELRCILVSMGGVDLPNATGQVLQALKACALPQDCCISVVMGTQAPWLHQVREQARDMPLPTEVLVNISDMAQRMADSDLAIGAAGGTSWERCCLGLPTLLVVLAQNQRSGAFALQQARAASLVGGVDDIATQLPPAVVALTQGPLLAQMGGAAKILSDGLGADRLLRAMGVAND